MTLRGTPGAEPDEVAGLLTHSSAAGVLAIDLSTSIGAAERTLLAELLASCPSIALAGVGAGLDEDWPRRLTTARDQLDPDHRLPVFAICLEAVRAGEDGGVAALAQWCVAPDTEVPAGFAVGDLSEDVAPDPQRAAPDPARGRAERWAGARAGLSQARAATAAELREQAVELTRTAEEVAGARAATGDVVEWLRRSLATYRERASSRLESDLDQVRRAALVGLPRGDDAADEPRAADLDTELPVEKVPALVQQSGFRAEDAAVMVVGASAGLGLGRMIVAPLVEWAGLGALGTVLTVLAGLAMAAGVVGIRRRAAAVTVRRRALAEAIIAARMAAEHAAVAQISETEARLHRELWNRTRAWSVKPSRDVH